MLHGQPPGLKEPGADPELVHAIHINPQVLNPYHP